MNDPYATSNSLERERAEVAGVPAAPARDMDSPERDGAAGQPAWGPYVDALVHEHGTLAAVAERLAAAHGYAEDVESIERALRRLRTRGSRSGGKWGARLLRQYGLPATIDARLRFMGSYHSRFVDLPVSLALDLVGLWDRPPVSESRPGRVWLSLARACLAFRSRALDDAGRWLTRASEATPDAMACVEIALGRALLESRDAPAVVPGALSVARRHLDAVTHDDHHCLRARLAGQVAYALNRSGRHEDAEAVLVALPDGPDVPAFARARRANGLAYVRWALGDASAALTFARESARHAGDAGHVRLRAMALLMITRVASGTDEARDALARARQIGRVLEDETLLHRASAAGPELR